MEKLLKFNGIRFPKGMPADTVLRYIVAPPPSQHFLPSIHSKTGKRKPPRIPYGMQQKIRNACLMADIDPSSIGLPPLESPLETYNNLPETAFVPLGKGYELQKFKRQLKIQENLDKMDTRIAEWKAVIIIIINKPGEEESKRSI